MVEVREYQGCGCSHLLLSIVCISSLSFFFMLDYPEFMTLNSNRLNFLFTTKEECCRVHSCVVSTKADYWWPAVESDIKKCNYGSGTMKMVYLSSVFIIFEHVSNILIYPLLRLSILDGSKLKHTKLFIYIGTGLLCTT